LLIRTSSPLPGLSRIPYWGTTLLILVVYLVYFPFSGYASLYFDAEYYWFISIYFHHKGSLSLFNFHDNLRGYFMPLLLLPLRIAQYYSEVPAIWFARVLGAGSAAFGFGLLGPLLWQVVSGAAAPLAWPRRVAFAALGFLLWRDYFNFTLTDFPALWALGLGLLLLCRPQLWRVAAAGACLAAACNMRPSYLVAAPFFMVLAWLAVPGGAQWRGARVLALLAGAAVVLGPQFIINQRHFQQSSPLVLAQDENLETDNLYREKLKWGLLQQKYETSLTLDYPQPVMVFRDEAGEQLVRTEHVEWFDSYADYARLVLRHPLLFAKMYAQRLFNGLDLQYPTPYIRQVYQSTLGLAWLNYTVWFGALLVMVPSWARRLRLRQWLVLAALLVPCLPMLAINIECRYLLPLHLLLYAVLCFGWPAAWRPTLLPRRQLVLVGVAYVVFVGLCFVASAATQATLELGPRALW
jgi:hypothetical protein